MNPLTFYVETSAWGSLAPRQPRDRKQVLLRLLKILDGVLAACVISDVVLEEISEAPSNEAEQIRRHIEQRKPTVYPISADVEALADAYIAAGVLPKGREADALHVAVATCRQVDYPVSWNHRHMTRPTKRVQFESVNLLRGYLRTPLICNPFEACDELRNR